MTVTIASMISAAAPETCMIVLYRKLCHVHVDPDHREFCVVRG